MIFQSSQSSLSSNPVGNDASTPSQIISLNFQSSCQQLVQVQSQNRCQQQLWQIYELHNHLKCDSQLVDRQQFYQQKTKTELCKNYESNGICKFGDNCSFAHGKNQIKSKQNLLNPRYKTKPCRNFFILGQCNYGTRCQYQHKEVKKNHNFELFLKNLYTTKGIPLKTVKSPKRLPIFDMMRQREQTTPQQTLQL